MESPLSRKLHSDMKEARYQQVGRRQPNWNLLVKGFIQDEVNPTFLDTYRQMIEIDIHRNAEATRQI